MIFAMKKFVQLIFIVLSLGVPLAATAGDAFPGQAPSRSELRIQEKVDSLFEKGDYERAMFIYEKELSPLGDKFAQYMVGYMHVAGKGVTQDAILASAWYRLAAERGHDEYVRVRDKLLTSMNDEQRTRSDSLFFNLRRRMGDAALISNLIEQDVTILESRREPIPISGSNFERNTFRGSDSINAGVAKRLDSRAKYLNQLIDSDESLSRGEHETLGKSLADAQRVLDAYIASN